MSKIVIKLTDDGETIITYDNGSIIYPICEVTKDNFNISEVTDTNILILISNLIHQTGNALRYQLVKQGIVNKPLNKPADRK